MDRERKGPKPPRRPDAELARGEYVSAEEVADVMRQRRAQ